ncbi:methyltransferase family protein [Terracoccus luteus]|uniref:Methyltransferase family protein n=1 Tax=Terracoccus luteus TaxID=53356 RepID=A0A495XXL0_9MICO|nr:class I SAM-dependent methyltransferase [Terracoccus luteus]RKT79331.1 methyltransferase family protein [Terracoccus luteus]
MDASDWDARYAATDLVWSVEPNRFVAEIFSDLSPGAVLDVAAGEGRNAIWLAEQDWHVMASDYSVVAVERMRTLATKRLGDDSGRLTAVVSDATQAAPRPAGPGATGEYDAVLFCYLQLPLPERAEAWRRGVEALRPGGRLVVVGHAGRNLTEGHGGPSSRDVLYDPDEVIAEVAGLPVDVVDAGVRDRPVPTADGERVALDIVVVLRRR